MKATVTARMAAAAAAMVVAVTASVMAGSGTAYAGSGWIYTSDADPGGKTRFLGRTPEHFSVCDIEEDGWAAVAWLWVDKPGPGWVGKRLRAGGNGNCEGYTRNITEGRRVTLHVCLSNGEEEKFCSETWRGRA
ncbi:MAG: hypothetical protein GEV03_12410 [Streptosporangiales bacterium]|nr:hypothetical protein [Streptosporangiales bacterium]